MQEELASHQKERGVMEEPAHEQESTETVVFYNLCCWIVSEAYGWTISSLTVVKIPIPAFFSENEKATDDQVGNCGECTRPPDERVTNEVNLFVILDPEVLHVVSVGYSRCNCEFHAQCRVVAEATGGAENRTHDDR